MVTKSIPTALAAKKAVAKVKPATQAVSPAVTKQGAKTPAKKTVVSAVKKVAAVAQKAVAPETVKVKAKMIRDSFTMPKVEYAVIDALKQRAATLTRPTKKSELLRAGVKALSAMTDSAFLAALSVVPTIKTGRPGKD